MEHLKQNIALAFENGIPLDKQWELLESLDVQCKVEWKNGERWLHVTSAVGNTSTLLHFSSSVW